MEKFTGFNEFYNNHYSKDMTKGFGSITGCAAAELCNVAEYLKSCSDSSEIPPEQIAAQCAEAIERISRQLSRTSLFCGAITKTPLNFRHFHAESYLSNFVKNCEIILGEKLNINLCVRQDFSFSSVSDLLDLLLLGFMRKALSSYVFMGPDSSPRISFEIYASVKNDIKEITLYTGVNTPQNSYNAMGAADFFNDYFSEIANITAENLGVKAHITPNRMTIQFDSDENDDRIVAEQKIVQLLGDSRSLYRTMLGDLCQHDRK